MKRLLILTLLIFTNALIVGCQNASGGLTEEQANKLDTAYELASAVPYPTLDEVRRGCPACHTLVDRNSGKYTLAYEAYNAKSFHFELFKPTDDVNVARCLECHAAGTGEREGKGAKAPLSMQDINHPSHMSNQVFKLHYGGNCFSCHNVNSAGEFQLLTEKVEVNSEGLPDPSKIPIPGAK